MDKSKNLPEGQQAMTTDANIQSQAVVNALKDIKWCIVRDNNKGRNRPK